MSHSNDNGDFSMFSPSKIPGRTRLLSLKGIVVFPNVLTGFQFDSQEEISIIEGALRENRIIAIGTEKEPQKGEKTRSKPVRVEKIGCLCRVLAHHRQEEGGINVLVVGLCRVRFEKELRRIHGKERDPHRWMQIQPFHDEYPLEDSTKWIARKKQLRQILSDYLRSKDKKQTDPIRDLLKNVESFGNISDILASLFDFPTRNKLKLLREHLVDRRLALLIQMLREVQSNELYDELHQRLGSHQQSLN